MKNPKVSIISLILFIAIILGTLSLTSCAPTLDDVRTYQGMESYITNQYPNSDLSDFIQSDFVRDMIPDQGHIATSEKGYRYYNPELNLAMSFSPSEDTTDIEITKALPGYVTLKSLLSFNDKGKVTNCILSTSLKEDKSDLKSVESEVTYRGIDFRDYTVEDIIVMDKAIEIANRHDNTITEKDVTDLIESVLEGRFK